jgi:hypothetical protein
MDASIGSMETLTNDNHKLWFTRCLGLLLQHGLAKTIAEMLPPRDDPRYNEAAIQSDKAVGIILQRLGFDDANNVYYDGVQAKSLWDALVTKYQVLDAVGESAAYQQLVGIQMHQGHHHHRHPLLLLAVVAVAMVAPWHHPLLLAVAAAMVMVKKKTQ